jgi:hypothetical protein
MMNPRMEAVTALDIAIDAVKLMDHGDPTTETGRASEELLDAWNTLQRLRDYFLNEEDQT